MGCGYAGTIVVEMAGERVEAIELSSHPEVGDAAEAVVETSVVASGNGRKTRGVVAAWGVAHRTSGCTCCVPSYS